MMLLETFLRHAKGKTVCATFERAREAKIKKDAANKMYKSPLTITGAEWGRELGALLHSQIFHSMENLT